jgi:hypothetical protein
MVSEVGLHHRGTSAAIRDLGNQAIGLGARASHLHRDRVAVLRQRQRDGAADALAAASDERGAMGLGWQFRHQA